MRQRCNHEELEAHRILDGVRAGIDAPSTTITWALWILGDAVGIEKTVDQDHMKQLHISEPRCSGRDTKPNPTICPLRNTCRRHMQVEFDIQLGIAGTNGIKVMALPYVPGQACHYRLKV